MYSNHINIVQDKQKDEHSFLTFGNGSLTNYPRLYLTVLISGSPKSATYEIITAAELACQRLHGA